MFSGDGDWLNYFLIDKSIHIYEYVGLMCFEWNKMKDFCETWNDIEVFVGKITEHVDIIMKPVAFER